MSANPSTAAWEADPFWKDVVNILTGGKKLRSDAYLYRLTAEDLDSLRLVLFSSLPLEEQVKAAPKWRGGLKDGEPPSMALLSGLGSAIREANLMQSLERQQMLAANAKARCGSLGLDATMTDAVLTVLAEEALKRQMAGSADSFLPNAANALLTREGMKAKAELEKAKLALRERAEQRQSGKLKFEIERFQFDAAQAALKHLPALRQIAASSSLDQRAKVEAARKKLFGDLADVTSPK